LALANGEDEILLLRPDGTEADRVVWGGASSLRTTAGKSLERITFGLIPVWLAGSAAWPGSAGDFGSPGRGFVAPRPTATAISPETPTPTATLPPTVTPRVTVSPTPTGSGAATVTVTVTATPTPAVSSTQSPTPTPTEDTAGSGLSTLFISEFLADPAAVSDANGEWVELYNAGPDGVNLKDWTLADLDSDQHTIASDLFLAPGQFVVLGRNGNLLENGGVALSYIYAGFTLANGEDEIRLLRPDGTEEDRVIWGGESSLRTTPGKSLERTGFGPVAVWLVAETPWPGSAGDFGTPGRGFEPPAATETATATGTADSGQQTATATTTPATTPATPAMTTTPSVTSTPTPSATSVSLPARWPPRAEPAPLRIDEVNFLGSDLEFVVLVNVGDAPVDLTGWLVGDGAVPGGGEGLYELPPGHFLAPNTPFVIARNGAAFHVRWGQPAHAQFENSASAAPVLARRRELASGSLALNDSGDEVLLLDPSLNLADAVVWGNGDGASLGLTGTLYPVADRSLQRVPGFAFPDQREQRHRFLWAAPAPFASVTLPESAVLPSPPLADGLQAVWGSLGATSSFSPGGAAPPHYVQAAG
ncbi:MAG: lamin tail domain-containing protein, partial [Caldilineaceae bacterium]